MRPPLKIMMKKTLTATMASSLSGKPMASSGDGKPVDGKPSNRLFDLIKYICAFQQLYSLFETETKSKPQPYTLDPIMPGSHQRVMKLYSMCRPVSTWFENSERYQLCFTSIALNPAFSYLYKRKTFLSKSDLSFFFDIKNPPSPTETLKEDVIMSLYAWNTEISADVKILNNEINMFIRVNQVGLAFSFLGKIFKLGLRPTLGTYDPLVRGLCYEGKTGYALRLHDEMIFKGCTPSFVTYVTLIAALCKAGDTSATMEICRRSHYKYNTIILRLYEGGWYEAIEVLLDMLGEDSVPSLRCYNTLIRGYCNIGRINGAARLLEDLRRKKLIPGIVTYNTLLHGLCRIGRTRDAIAFFYKMLAQGQIPNFTTFRILIYYLGYVDLPHKAEWFVKAAENGGLELDARVDLLLSDLFWICDINYSGICTTE